MALHLKEVEARRLAAAKTKGTKEEEIDKMDKIPKIKKLLKGNIKTNRSVTAAPH